MTNSKRNIIGVGDAGANIAELFYSKNYDQSGSFLTITTPARNYSDKKIQNIFFKPPKHYADFIGWYLVNKDVSPKKSEYKKLEDWVNEDVIKSMDLINPVLHDFLLNYDEFIIFACLGRFTGTIFSIKLAETLQKLSKRFAIIATLPFTFETLSIYVLRKAISILHGYPNFFYFDLSQIENKYMELPVSVVLKKADEKMLFLYNDLLPIIDKHFKLLTSSIELIK